MRFAAVMMNYPFCKIVVIDWNLDVIKIILTNWSYLLHRICLHPIFVT